MCKESVFNMINDEGQLIRNIFIIVMLVGFVVLLITSILAIKFIVVDPKDKGRVNGVITNITNKTTTVEYTVNNRCYKRTFNLYVSNYYEGKKVKLLYNKTKPNDVSIASLRYLFLIGPAIGIVILGVSGVGLIYVYIKYYKNTNY